MRTERRAAWVVLLCLLASLLLAIAPLPDWLDLFRPVFPLLALVFWSIALPERYGTWTGWLLGLVFDVLRGTPLGAHALAFAVAAFAASRLSARIKVFPTVQQALVVGAIVGGSTVIQHLLAGLGGSAVNPGFFATLLPVAATALVWPWAQGLQDHLRRRFNVS
ncbi:MAG: rod shape-determining protein MreD [Pseudomonadota bacterium]